MQNQYENYNQNINKVMFNPYSYRINQDSTTSSTHSANNVRSTSSIVSAQYAKSEDGDHHRRDSHDWNSRQYLQAALTTFQMEGIDKKSDDEPGVNYFVNEFEKLQNQNKYLHSVLKQKQLSISTLSSMAHSSQSQSNTKNLVAQNQTLRKQLEQQRTKSKLKNEQISQLMNKIVEIQKNVQTLTNSKSKENQQIDTRIKKQIQSQQELKLQVESLKTRQIQKERQMAEQIVRIRLVIESEAERKKNLQFNRLIQNISRQRQQQSIKLKQQIENIKSYYNQIINKNWQALTDKIQQLQHELSSAHSFYTDLSHQVQQLSNLSSKPREASKGHRSSKQPK